MEDLLTTDPVGVGSYRFAARLGAGGMGVVYLSATPAGGPVAVKVVRAELADAPGFRARFHNEVELARRVTGPRTVAIVDADPDGVVPYLVTELVTGDNLEQLVGRAGPLGGVALVGLVVGVAEALVAMGAAGVVHRDLKPANVLLAGDGPKVIDFGISRAIDEPSMTQTGLVRGSPAWMAPEQALGLPVTAKTDVFAWGALAAYASTGRPPFGAGRPEAVLYRVVHEPPDLRGVDPGLLPWVAGALDKDPDRRPPAGQLVRAWTGWGRPVGRARAAPAPSSAPVTAPVGGASGPPSGRSPHRRAGVVAACLVVGVVAGAAGAGAVVALRHADADRQVTGKEAGRVSTTVPGHRTSGGTSRGTSRGTTAGGSGGAPTGTTTTTTGPSTVSAVLPLVPCPTEFGLDPPSDPPTLPSSVSEPVASSLARQLAVYTDEQGSYQVVGPEGWSCSATRGADGSATVEVFPTGSSPPTDEGNIAAGDEQAIDLTDTGGCAGCALTTASPLFPTAASACASEFLGDASSCPSVPPGEERFSISSDAVGFEDPAGVSGDGEPSGGDNPANGVMVFSMVENAETWVQTCTLPPSFRATCTASLSSFVRTYAG